MPNPMDDLGFEPIVAAVNRTELVKKQLRDRKGRWVEMGAEAKLLSKKTGEWLNGTIDGIDGEYAIVKDIKKPDGTPVTPLGKVHYTNLEMLNQKADLDDIGEPGPVKPTAAPDAPPAQPPSGGGGVPASPGEEPDSYGFDKPADWSFQGQLEDPNGDESYVFNTEAGNRVIARTRGSMFGETVSDPYAYAFAVYKGNTDTPFDQKPNQLDHLGTAQNQAGVPALEKKINADTGEKVERYSTFISAQDQIELESSTSALEQMFAENSISEESPEFDNLYSALFDFTDGLLSDEQIGKAQLHQQISSLRDELHGIEDNFDEGTPEAAKIADVTALLKKVDPEVSTTRKATIPGEPEAIDAADIADGTPSGNAPEPEIPVEDLVDEPPPAAALPPVTHGATDLSSGTTPDEDQALDEYISGQHWMANGYLRDDFGNHTPTVKDLQQGQRMAQHMSAVLDRSTLNQNKKLYRTVRDGSAIGWNPDVIEDKGFISFSDSLENSKNFLHPVDPKISAIIEVDIPAGSKGFDVNAYAEIDDDEYAESEFILPPQKFTVISDDFDENGVRYLKVVPLAKDDNGSDSAPGDASTGAETEDPAPGSGGANDLDSGSGDGNAEVISDAEAEALSDTAVASPFQILDDPGASGDGYFPGTHQWGKYGAAGVMLRHVDEDGTERFLMVQRGPIVSTNKGKWQLPGGALNSNENDYQGTARELWEELQTPDGYMDTIKPKGEVRFEHSSGWHYTNIAAQVDEQFEPTVDGTETGDAGWFTREEIAELPLHPSLASNLDKIFGTFDESEGDADTEVADAEPDKVIEDPWHSNLQEAPVGSKYESTKGVTHTKTAPDTWSSPDGATSNDESLSYDAGNGKSRLIIPSKSDQDAQATETKSSSVSVASLSEPLSDDEIQTVDSYTGYAHEGINEFLRGGYMDVPDVTKQQIAELQAAISKSTLTADMTVYRGADGTSWFEGLEPGSTFSDKAFVSMSKDRDTALGFAFQNGAQKPVLLELDLPAGTHAIDVADIATTEISNDESELLGDTDLEFEVLSIEQTGSFHTVRARLVGKKNSDEADTDTGESADTGAEAPGAGEATGLDSGPGDSDASTGEGAGDESNGGVDGDTSNAGSSVAEKPTSQQQANDQTIEALGPADYEIDLSGGEPDAGLAQAAAEDNGAPIDVTSWKKVGAQKGSNPGGIYESDDGTKYYVKQAKSAEHAKNEVLADNLYQLAGIDTSKLQLADVGDGKIGTASEMIDGAKLDLQQKLKDSAYKAKLQEGFAMDAWLANWDVAGLDFDNVVSDGDGKPVRVDPGGALIYRAQGAPKGNAFGNSAGEWDTLRNGSNAQSKALFGDMTDEQLKASALKVAAITPEQITAEVDKLDFSPETRDKLIGTLNARRLDLMDRAGVTSADLDNGAASESDVTPDASVFDFASAPAGTKVTYTSIASESFPNPVPTVYTKTDKGNWLPDAPTAGTNNDLTSGMLQKAFADGRVTVDGSAQSADDDAVPEPDSIDGPDTDETFMDSGSSLVDSPFDGMDYHYPVKDMSVLDTAPIGSMLITGAGHTWTKGPDGVWARPNGDNDPASLQLSFKWSGGEENELLTPKSGDESSKWDPSAGYSEDPYEDVPSADAALEHFDMLWTNGEYDGPVAYQLIDGGSVMTQPDTSNEDNSWIVHRNSNGEIVNTLSLDNHEYGKLTWGPQVPAENLSSTTPVNAPAVGFKEFGTDANGNKYVSTPDGQNIMVGTKVKSKTDNVESVVIQLENNGEYVRLENPNGGKPLGRKIKTLDVIGGVQPASTSTAPEADEPASVLPETPDEDPVVYAHWGHEVGDLVDDVDHLKEMPIGTEIEADDEIYRFDGSSWAQLNPDGTEIGYTHKYSSDQFGEYTSTPTLVKYGFVDGNEEQSVAAPEAPAVPDVVEPSTEDLEDWEKELLGIPTSPMSLDAAGVGSTFETTGGDGVSVAKWTKHTDGKWYTGDGGTGVGFASVLFENSIKSGKASKLVYAMPEDDPDNPFSTSNVPDVGQFDEPDLPSVPFGTVGTTPTGQKYVMSADGKPMMVGTVVKSKTDNLTGKITQIENNGKYVRIENPNGGKPLGRSIKTLTVVDDGTQATPSTPPTPEPVPDSPKTPRLGIGDSIPTLDTLDALPTGTTIQNADGTNYTKTPDGLWKNAEYGGNGYKKAAFISPGVHTWSIKSYGNNTTEPEPAPDIDVAPPVDTPISLAQMDTLPDGTVVELVTEDGEILRVKKVSTEPGFPWRTVNEDGTLGSSYISSGWYKLQNASSVKIGKDGPSAPDAASYNGLQVGDQPQSPADMDKLPAGSTMQYIIPGTDNGVYRKKSTGKWEIVNEDGSVYGDYSADQFTDAGGEIPYKVTSVGGGSTATSADSGDAPVIGNPVPSIKHMNDLPAGSVISYNSNPLSKWTKLDNGNWGSNDNPTEQYPAEDFEGTSPGSVPYTLDSVPGAASVDSSTGDNSVVAIDPPSISWNVGDWLNDKNDLDSMPIGSSAQFDTGALYVKHADGWHYVDMDGNQSPNAVSTVNLANSVEGGGGAMKVMKVGSDGTNTPAGDSVGQVIAQEDLAGLPDGSIVTDTDGDIWKIENGTWLLKGKTATTWDPIGVKPPSSAYGPFTLQSTPGAPSVTTVPDVSPIWTVQTLNDLPNGTVVSTAVGSFYRKGEDGSWYRYWPDKGTSGTYVTNPTSVLNKGNVQVHNPGAPTATPTPVSAPTVPDVTIPGVQLVGANGVAFKKGDKVKHPQFGIGTVKTIEGQGTHTKVLFDSDGKVHGVVGKKVTKLDEATGTPTAPVFAPPSSSPATPNPGAVQPSANTAQADPTSPWFGAPSPDAPTPPENATFSDGGTDYVPTGWLEKAAEYYKANKNPNKTIQESNYWHKVEAVIKSGNKTELAKIRSSNLISQELHDEALATIQVRELEKAKVDAANATKAAAYATEIQKYHENLRAWKKANGLVDPGFSVDSYIIKGMNDNVVEESASKASSRWAKLQNAMASFSSSAKSAISSYVGSSSSLNGRLRSDKKQTLNPEYAPYNNVSMFKGMEKAMEEAVPLENDEITMRGADLREWMLPDGTNVSDMTEFLAKWKPGMIAVDWGYGSTSVGAPTQKYKSTAAFSHKKMQMKIRVPKGYKAVFVGYGTDLGHHKPENELILQRGTHYYIHSIEQHGNQIWADVEIVPAGWTPE